jgi:hypothetical protein
MPNTEAGVTTSRTTIKRLLRWRSRHDRDRAASTLDIDSSGGSFV